MKTNTHAPKLLLPLITAMIIGCAKVEESDPELTRKLIGIWYTAVKMPNNQGIVYQAKIHKADGTIQNKTWTFIPGKPLLSQDDIFGDDIRLPLEEWKISPGKLYTRTQGSKKPYQVITFRFIDDDQFAVPNPPQGETVWRRTELSTLKRLMERGEGVPSEPTKSGAGDWRTFTDPSYAFTVEYPKEWQKLADYPFAAQVDDDTSVMVQAIPVAPISDPDRELANQRTFDETFAINGLKSPTPTKSPAGVARLFYAGATMTNGYWNWCGSTTAGDVTYQIFVGCTVARREALTPLAKRILESFRVVDAARAVGSPYGSEPVIQHLPEPPPTPADWTTVSNKIGFRFAHDKSWKLIPRSGENGYEMKGDDLHFTCAMGQNQVTAPPAFKLRPGLRSTFDKQLPADFQLDGEPKEVNVGIAKGLVGRLVQKNGSKRLWLCVAVCRDFVYLMRIGAAEGSSEIIHVVEKTLDSFAVTEELNVDEFYKRLTDRALPKSLPAR